MNVLQDEPGSGALSNSGRLSTCWLACRRDPEVRLAPLLLIAWILFILVVNGPIASPKYRLPLEPAFAVFFALAFDDLRRRLTRVRAASAQE